MKIVDVRVRISYIDRDLSINFEKFERDVTGVRCPLAFTGSPRLHGQFTMMRRPRDLDRRMYVLRSVK